ncbi:MAG: S-methyl-5-thioribose-1-phosphate isomerase [Acidobacteria bacterium]|nr:S-methyl-5-thioribose-1-phosphate isomerase [Acidobacteriota bacterium]NIM64309.1 S-methyl-5-thioribose-1-phosphate isomerase [Acidobacteriota bacterium]NIQ84952.1 S-methyl-5-thioribose-1-phosphate isomerase [Acidobacteriota bacterium]NIT10766.1 S-methyl-5-thioribose-1-phosphate isomerase [Acidobacteriota bacterium]
MFRTAERTAHGVRLIDQRKLPLEETYVELRSPEQVAQAIRDMVVRGAPAIGITAAFGLALGAKQTAAAQPQRFSEEMERILAHMESARPTAVNLAWAVRRMRDVMTERLANGGDPDDAVAALEREAQAIHDEDLAACKAMGAHGAALVPEQATVLTHCNAGGLATAGYGTALGVIRGAVEAGKRVRVLADETRPFLQGARLTAWELLADGIDTTLITDGMAGSLMRRGEIDLVVVGSDRIAANGDIANKIGTYTVAVLAKENGIPFYVAAPMSTIDFDCPDGDSIPIEERDPSEVTELFGTRVAPDGVGVRNPAFDITPARYVHAIVTERGVARPPYVTSLAAMRER